MKYKNKILGSEVNTNLQGKNKFNSSTTEISSEVSKILDLSNIIIEPKNFNEQINGIKSDNSLENTTDKVFYSTLKDICLKIENDILETGKIGDIKIFIEKLRKLIDSEDKEYEFRDFLKAYNKLKNIYNSNDDKNTKLGLINVEYINNTKNKASEIKNFFKIATNSLGGNELIEYGDTVKTQLEALEMLRKMFSYISKSNNKIIDELDKNIKTTNHLLSIEKNN